MKQYQYTAINAKGKIKTGTIEAETKEEARLHLKDDMLNPLKIQEKSFVTRDYKMPWENKVTPKDMAKFLRQFSTIYDTGMPMIDTLALVRRQTTNKNLSTAIYSVIRSIEKGLSISAALEKESSIFSNMVCQMISVGEQSGTLVSVLDKLSIHYEKIQEAKDATIKAMIYPCIVMVVVLVVLAIMLTQVLPQFQEIFAASNTPLPYITRVVMASGDFVQDNYLSILFAILGIAMMLMAHGKTTSGQYVYGYIIRKIPVLKTFVTNQECAMFANSLSILHQAGLPILQSLDICKGSLKNIYFKNAIEEVRQLVIKGNKLGASLTSTEVFPSALCQMVTIGESSGRLSEMLEKTAHYFDQEAKVATERVLVSIEPAIMLCLCVFVGIIVFAIVLPMFTVYGTML